MGYALNLVIASINFSTKVLRFPHFYNAIQLAEASLIINFVSIETDLLHSFLVGFFHTVFPD